MLTTLLWQVDRDMEFDDFENWFENLKLERANGVEKLNARIRLSQYFDEVLEGNLHVIVEVPATGEFEQPLAVTAYLIASPCPRFITLTISPTLLVAVTRSHLLSHLPVRFDARSLTIHSRAMISPYARFIVAILPYDLICPNAPTTSCCVSPFS
jgi:hypothetical protein